MTTQQGGQNYGLMNTAQGLMERPYGGINPMGPAGITDLERQGQMTQLQGMGSQYAPAQQYADQAGQFANGFQNDFSQRMNSGGFGWNPQMQGAYGMAQQSGQNNPFTSQAAQANQRGMTDNRMAYQGANMYGRSANQPGFGQSNQAIGQTMGQYGGGYSNPMADLINQTGASFDPFNNPALGSAISDANQRLGRDFNQSVMPEMNRAAIGAGPGAYGGTRAGVSQGLREQGLADAMQSQTTNMANEGYAQGLNRYVQDRGQTVSATLDAMRTGGDLGLRGAGLFGDNAYRQGQLQGTAAQGLGQIGQNLSANQLRGGQQFGQLSQQQQAAQQGAASQMGALGQNSLDQNNAMFRYGGTQMPQIQAGAYQAAMQPGQIQQGMGQAMQGFGQGQQGQNQRVQDWYNNQYNNAQNYPQDRFNNYVNQTGQFLTAGGQTPVQQPGRNPYADAVGAGSAGYGMYDLWNQNRSQSNPLGGQSGQGYNAQTPGGYNVNLPGNY